MDEIRLNRAPERGICLGSAFLPVSHGAGYRRYLRRDFLLGHAATHENRHRMAQGAQPQTVQDDHRQEGCWL